jgi:ribosome-associated translation inhibitor RaiA
MESAIDKITVQIKKYKEKLKKTKPTAKAIEQLS